jgi:hypothetical protein
MRVHFGAQKCPKSAKNDENRRFACICAQFSAKNRAAIDIVSEIELLTPSAFTIPSPETQNARCARMSSRACKPATFVEEAPPKPPIQEDKANQATPNHPPSPNKRIPQQHAPEYGENGNSRVSKHRRKKLF